jgi:hypothetical protein
MSKRTRTRRVCPKFSPAQAALVERLLAEAAAAHRLDLNQAVVAEALRKTRHAAEISLLKENPLCPAGSA